jgi:hypothetical protein
MKSSLLDQKKEGGQEIRANLRNQFNLPRNRRERQSKSRNSEGKLVLSKDRVLFQHLQNRRCEAGSAKLMRVTSGGRKKKLKI